MNEHPQGLDAVAFWQRSLRGWEYVYVIQGDEGTPIKVGRALDPAARLRTLQTGNPQTLRVLHAIPGDSAVESMCHRHLRFSRVQGEWFDGPAVPRFLERFARHSDQLILRHIADGAPPQLSRFLEEPEVRFSRTQGLRTPNIRNGALLGHRHRTSPSSPAEVNVRHVPPDPLTPEASLEFENRLRDRDRPDPAEYGWGEAA